MTPRGRSHILLKIMFTSTIFVFNLSCAVDLSRPTVGSLSVTVAGTESSDPRWAAVDEAVEFWNHQLGLAGVNVWFGPITRVLHSVGTGTHQYKTEGQHGTADIIIVLTNDDIISFGRSWRPDHSGFVALRRADIPPLSLPNVLRNVIAHELGHVLGLSHNNDPRTLMCGRPAPCRPGEFASKGKRFFPLTEKDKTKLQQLPWQSDIE